MAMHPQPEIDVKLMRACGSVVRDLQHSRCGLML